MEQTNNIIIIISFGVILTFLWVFYFWFYWQYRIDKARQELFAIRDELFDFAINGNISFNHPAYGILRRTMNGMVRFTHKIDFINLIAIILFIKTPTPHSYNFFVIFNKAISDIKSEDVRKKLEDFVIRMNKIIVVHLIKGSIPLFFIVAISIIVIIIAQGWKNLKDTIVKKFPGIEEIDNVATELG